MIRSSWFAGDEAGSECSMVIVGLGKPITDAGTMKAMTSLADAALVVWPGKRLFLYRREGRLGLGAITGMDPTDVQQAIKIRIAELRDAAHIDPPFVRTGGLRW